MATNPSYSRRMLSIDLLRGMVMVIMALDHLRDLLGNATISGAPLDLKTTTPALFFTRWITHLCAPTFVFLSGVSAYLGIQKNDNIRDSRRFLFTRGIWLVIVNFTLNNFLIFFDIHFGVIFSQVIAAIGFGLIALSLMLSLSPKIIGAVGLIIIFGHELLDSVVFAKGSPMDLLWTLLMNSGVFPLSGSRSLLISYPLIPWLGIMMAGFGLGLVFKQPAEKRKKIFLGIGIAALVLFVLVRASRFYGDPFSWSVQKTWFFTLLSFINTTKYPPSLLFTLMTLGIAIILLGVLENVQNRLGQIISVYGKVPLFYWLIHWFIIHCLAIGVFLCQGFRYADLQFGGFGFGRPKTGGGLALPGLYLAWLALVIFLYPVSKWYGNYKSSHPEKKWLSFM
jgi:uncharacterized membrane protein